MGQYYKPCILADKTEETQSEKVLGWVYSHEYNNGLKLMEHSWLRNDFVNTFEKLLSPRGKFNKARVVWAGDYADGEPEMTHQNEEGRAVEVNLYELCENENKLKPKRVTKSNYRFILNHTKKQFVDKEKVPVSEYWTDDKTGKKYPFTIHPLPLLTCEGNGRGGGDFRGDERGQVGVWARHSISVANKVPNGYTEFTFDLTE
jgi:hypothetical protein